MKPATYRRAGMPFASTQPQPPRKRLPMRINHDDIGKLQYSGKSTRFCRCIAHHCTDLSTDDRKCDWHGDTLIWRKPKHRPNAEAWPVRCDDCLGGEP